jgi:predicted transcriptional regulator YheO
MTPEEENRVERAKEAILTAINNARLMKAPQRKALKTRLSNTGLYQEPDTLDLIAKLLDL